MNYYFNEYKAHKTPLQYIVFLVHQEMVANREFVPMLGLTSSAHEDNAPFFSY
jgi:hypothetical protein